MHAIISSKSLVGQMTYGMQPNETMVRNLTKPWHELAAQVSPGTSIPRLFKKVD